ncbi:CBS domain-containing protein [Brevundimonas sp. 2R-24]|uniref:CBS domain-containing protein n=1 Tax=Peiella sedimenti TaxID=3061083 RepID=A0ABT8SN44_9CAUL|nr:CBS domain-containing protein [Caulobacteraceae bacterium XZ-24]
MRVRSLMHEGVVCADADATARDLARLMRENDVGCIPISDNGQMIGIITDRDVTLRVTAAGGDPDAVRAREFMSTRLVTCSPEDRVEDAAGLMQRHQIRRLPVLDDQDALVGMLSLGDLAGRVDDDMQEDILEAVAEHHI